MLKINLLILFFLTFFTSYSQYTINTIDAIELQQKAIEIKNSKTVEEFIKRAQETNVTEAKIDSIIYAKLLQDYRIAALKEHAKTTNKSFLINITDQKFDKNSFVREYRKTISSLLSKEQFQYVYKELLDLQIVREVPQTIAEIKKEYKLNKPSDRKVMRKWIEQYTLKAVTEQQYYGYDKKLSKSKYKEVLAEAALKYKEVLKQLKVDLVTPLPPIPETPEQLFVKKAKSVGVNESIAQRIIDLSNKTKAQIKGIEKLNKSDSPHIYILETSQNSKDGIRKNAQAYLTQLITINQFGELFGDQLAADIETGIKNRMQQIMSVYKLTDKQYEDMESLVSDYINKDILITHYYSFDKKLKKQKRKVTKFKFDAGYKKKIKTITESQQ